MGAARALSDQDGTGVRYLIFGAGAVGGTIGGRLIEAGHEVALIARGAHLDELRHSGLRLQRPDADHTYPVKVFGSPAEADLGDADVVVMAMKTQHSSGAVETLSAVASPELPVVCAQNGVEGERLSLRHFPRTYAMCVRLPADHLEPGVVRSYGAPSSGVLDLGCYPSGTDELATTIASDLDTSGFSSRPVEAPMRAKYGKLVLNLANALDALGGEEAKSSELAVRAREEAYEVLEQAGIDVATPTEDAERLEGLLDRRPVDGRSKGGSSTWQSLARRTGSIETDYLNGEIVLLGRLHGLPTPVNAALQREARKAALDGRPPASMSVAALTTIVDAAVSAAA